MELEDRLSDLPEGLIIDILSRMETQYAVRTCVLSKRWTRLWTQLALINLKLDSFDNVDSFQHFLLGLFTHYDASKLYSLRFQYSDVDENNDMDDRLVETIVDYATLNRVVHLSIDCFTTWKSIRLPSQLLACLEDLTLKYIMTIEFTLLSEFPELVKNEPSPFHNLKSFSVFRDNRVQSVVIPPEVEMFLVGASPNGSELFEGLLSELEKYYH
ncbi:hypothetical protein ACFE04_013516 [Oxalis oulophora]